MWEERRLVAVLAVAWALMTGLAAHADEVDWSEYMEPSAGAHATRPGGDAAVRVQGARRTRRASAKRAQAKRGRAKAAKPRSAPISRRR